MHCLNYEALTLTDALFMLDDPLNLSNCLATISFAPYDAQHMRQYLLTKLGSFHRCRSKLVKIMGLWWFKKMPEAEWNLKKDAVVIIKENIHTHE